MPTRKYLIFFVLILSILSSCKKEKTFSDTPSIALIDWNKVTEINGNDSISITFSFTDGDGNIGLSHADILEPFQEFNTDSTPNFYHYNCHIQLLEKVNGSFVSFTPLLPASFDSTQFDGRIPRLIVGDTPKSINGELTYGFKTFSTTSGQFSLNDTLKVRLKIIDRKLNNSNSIETGIIIVNQ